MSRPFRAPKPTFSPLSCFGIEEGAQQLGYDLLLLTGASGGAGRRRIFHENNRLRLADGCIILGREFRSWRAQASSSPVTTPLSPSAAATDADGPVPYVGADYVSATADLVRRARSLGHSRLGYVGPSRGAESSVDRWRGFQSELRGAELVLHIAESADLWNAMLAEIGETQPSALFFAELADAILVAEAARGQGLSIPGDLSIVVLGNHIRATQTGTHFTSFAIPREEMARQATIMLAERIETHTAGRQVLLACEPVEGETLGPICDRSAR
jgi:DNA-binding LacI/PurR family transcriptional regulator